MDLCKIKQRLQFATECTISVLDGANESEKTSETLSFNFVDYHQDIAVIEATSQQNHTVYKIMFAALVI